MHCNDIHHIVFAHCHIPECYTTKQVYFPPQIKESRCLIDLGQTERTERARLSDAVKCVRGKGKCSLHSLLQSYPKGFSLRLNCWSRNSEWVGIWRRGLRKLFRIRWGHKCGVLMMGLVALQEGEERMLYFHHVRIQREGGHLQAKRRDLTRNPISWHLDLGLLIFHICEK